MACHYWNNSGRTDTLVWVIFSKCMSWKSLDIGTASLLQTSQWNFKVLWFKCLHVSLEELNFPLLSPNACQSITNFWSGDQLSKSHHKVWVDGSGTWRCWFHFLIFLYDRKKIFETFWFIYFPSTVSNGCWVTCLKSWIFYLSLN